MNINRTLLSLTLLVTPLAHSAWAQDLLPTLSYWEMSFQLTRSSELREALNVTAEQKKRIEEMRAEPAWSFVFDLHANTLRQEDRNQYERIRNQIRGDKRLTDEQKKDGLQKLGFSWLNRIMSEKSYVSYTAANEKVKERLNEILTNEQLDDLYPTMLRAKYSNGCAPFQDLVFANYCGIPSSWPSDRESQNLKLIESRLESTMQSDLVDVCRTVVDALPTEPRNRMINLVGKFYAVNFPVTPIDDIPTNEITSARLILDSPSLQKDMRLSEQQLKQLREAEEVYENEFQSLARSRQLVKNKWIELDERLGVTIRACLDAQQQRQLQQQIHLQAFFHDLHYPLKVNIFRYLDLEPKDVAAFRTVVEQQQTKLRERRAVGDRRAFEEVAKMLPRAAQSKATQTFKGVWEITTVPPLSWHTLSDR